MIRRALGLIVVGGVLVLVACSDDATPEKYPTADSFCTAKATEECKVAAGPCAVPEATCQQKRKDACNTGLAATATGQGRTYKSANAENCIAKTTAVYADRTIDPAKETAYIEACEKVFAGLKKVNEACSNLYECEGDLLCDLDKKVCATKKVTGNEAPCNNPGDICDKGLYCQQKGALKFCTKKNAVGETCRTDGSAPCLEELRCNGSSCVAKQPAGELCDTNDECTTGLCDTTTTPRKCRAKQYASENGSCSDFGGAS